MNLLFQIESVKIHCVLENLSNLYRSFLSNYIKQDILSNKSLQMINPANPDYFVKQENIYIGTKATLIIKSNKIEKKEIDHFRTSILNFYVVLCTEIRKRFNFDSKVLNLIQYLGSKNYKPWLAKSIKTPI